MSNLITEEVVADWVERYEQAWRTTSPADIAAVFAPDAESHEWPYETDWNGLDEIIDGWKSREAWQAGGWTFTWDLLAINGDTFAVKGIGAYEELGNFDNLWVVTLDGNGRCSVLRMWNNQVE
jgi:hypothetical protein